MKIVIGPVESARKMPSVMNVHEFLNEKWSFSIVNLFTNWHKITFNICEIRRVQCCLCTMLLSVWAYVLVNVWLWFSLPMERFLWKLRLTPDSQSLLPSASPAIHIVRLFATMEFFCTNGATPRSLWRGGQRWRQAIHVISSIAIVTE